jgi:hypothetical protein
LDRGGEISSLWQRLTGRPGVVVLRGIRGVGKTPLVDTVLSKYPRYFAVVVQ